MNGSKVGDSGQAAFEREKAISGHSFIYPA